MTTKNDVRRLVLAAGLCTCAAAWGGSVADQPAVEVSEDGRLSVAPTPSPTDNIGWTASRASGPFETTPVWTLNLRRQVGAVRIGDLNGDGINDLAVGCFISNSFPPYTDWEDMIFYGSPTGLPAAPSWISADEVHTGDMQLGDINLDGALDLVSITGGTAFSPPRIYFGAPGGPATTPGWISAPPSAGWATSGILFDPDRDGDLDLMTTNQGVSPNAFRPMYIFFNSAGTLSTTPGWVSDESSIQNTLAAGDYDNDGFVDVAVSKWVNFSSAIYRNVGGTLQTFPIWTTGTTAGDRGAAWADLDNNGWLDLAIGTGNTDVYSNAAGVLSLTYSSAPPFSGGQELLLTDVDSDGDADLVEVHFSDGRTHVYLNTSGTLATAPTWTFDAAEVGNAIAVGDLTGDGIVDLAVGYSGNTSVRVFRGIAPPTCYANCDGSTIVPTLNALDFACFLSRYVAGEAYANCDGSTISPTLNALDFACYLSRYVAGCP